MNTPNTHIEEQAAAWVLRREEGLTPAQQDELGDWLAASPAHREAFARLQDSWSQLDRLGGMHHALSVEPDPDLLAPAPRERRFPSAWKAAVLPVLAVAACLTLAVVHGERSRASIPPSPVSAPAALLPAQCMVSTLHDGSLVTLSPDARFEERFTSKERRVILHQGRAFFRVAKNPARPFIVQTGLVDAVAVGTAFNVRVAHKEAEIYVEEGRVRMDLPESPGKGPVLGQGGSALRIRDGDLSLRQLRTEESARLLAWLPQMLEFADEPLDLVLGELNRRNNVRLRTDDPRLGGLRITASIRSDNVAGFLRLLEDTFNIAAEHQGQDLVLRNVETP